MNWTDTTFDRTKYEHPDPEFIEMMGEELVAEIVAPEYIDRAEQKFNERKTRFLSAWMVLGAVVSRDANGFYMALNSPNDNQACNAARQLYRILGDNKYLSDLLRARYNILEVDCADPAGWLDLKWDFEKKRYVPAWGTNWSDQNYSHGPSRPDVGDH